MLRCVTFTQHNPKFRGKKTRSEFETSQCFAATEHNIPEELNSQLSTIWQLEISKETVCGCSLLHKQCSFEVTNKN
jgi:hypothetical protein